MPVVIVLPSSSTASIANTTVGDIVQCAQRNLKHALAASGTPNLLITYVSDIHQQIMRRRRWKWAKSDPQRFVTERGQTSYWLGTSSQTPAGSVYTGHDFTDIQSLDTASVRNLTTGVAMYDAGVPPMGNMDQTEDGAYEEDLPFQFYNSRIYPHLLEVFPSPDEGSEYQIVPPAPHGTVVASGALSARTYYLRATFVDEAGNESLPSTTARQWIAANELVKVKSPTVPVGAGSAGITYNRYRVYASTTEGSETLQATTSIGTDWTEAGSGLTTNGATVPTTATIDPLRGYLIEFRYWRKHVNYTDLDEVLIVPDEYADVMCAGVTWMGAQYMKDWDFAHEWERIYQQGVARMSQNEEPWEAATYIRPDSRSVTAWM